MKNFLIEMTKYLFIYLCLWLDYYCWDNLLLIQINQFKKLSPRIVLSSANNTQWMCQSRSFMYRKNNNEPKTLPWRTPYLISLGPDNYLNWWIDLAQRFSYIENVHLDTILLDVEHFLVYC